MKSRTGAVLVTFAALGFLLSSCGKSNSNASSHGLDGDWAARSRQFSTFFANGTPGYLQGESYTTQNTTKIHFDGKGKFVFENAEGTSGGTYGFNVSDSLLTITPDSAGFLNYCYLGASFTLSTGNNTPAAPPLYHTPGVLYVAFRDNDSLSLAAGYVDGNGTNGDSIFLAKNGFIKL